MSPRPVARRWAVLLALVAAPLPVRAGPELGARAGWAFPVGSVQGGEALSRTYSGAVPLQLDAAWAFGPELSAGAFLQWGPALLAAPFRAAFERSSGSTLRLGAAARWRFERWMGFTPWAGAGAGWEWGLFSVRARASGTLRLSGPAAHLEGGAEWELPGRFRVGPCLELAGGQYLSARAEGGGETASQSIARRALHGWVALGVRGSVGF